MGSKKEGAKGMRGVVAGDESVITFFFIAYYYYISYAQVSFLFLSFSSGPQGCPRYRKRLYGSDACGIEESSEATPTDPI